MQLEKNGQDPVLAEIGWLTSSLNPEILELGMFSFVLSVWKSLNIDCERSVVSR